MTEEILIRAETPHDFAEVFEVNKTAFGQDNEAKLVDALRKNPAVFLPALSLVALVADKIAGHILFTRIHIKNETGTLMESLALAPVAVRPGWQKKGIGSQLIIEGLARAKEMGFKSVIVLGHAHYYPKFGFEPAARWNIRAPFNVPSNSFMAAELVNDGLKEVSGTVVYPKEFETV